MEKQNKNKRFLELSCKDCRFKNSAEKKKGLCVCLANLYHHTCTEQSKIAEALNRDYGLLNDGISQGRLSYFIKRNIRSDGQHKSCALKKIVGSVPNGNYVETLVNRLMFNKSRANTIGFNVEHLSTMLTNDPDFKKINESDPISLDKIINNDISVAYALAVAWAIAGDKTTKETLLDAFERYTPDTARADISHKAPIPFESHVKSGNDLLEELQKGNTLLYRYGKPNCCLLIGGGGSGKSTLINTLAKSTVMIEGSQVSFNIIRLHTFNASYASLKNYIAIEEIERGKNKVLILDGYDEISEEYRSTFCAMLADALEEWECGFVITSRTDIPALDCQKKLINRIHIKSLDEGSVKIYLCADKGEMNESYDALDDHLKKLITTPLFLVKFKAMWDGKNTLSNVNSRNELLNKYYEREKTRYNKSLLASRYIWDYAIPYIAFSATASPTCRSLWGSVRAAHKLFSACDDMAYAIERAKIELPIQSGYSYNLIEEMRDTLKIISVDSNTEDVTFEHMLIKDYFASRYISNIMTLAANEKDIAFRLGIIRASGISEVKWSHSVCRYVGEALAVSSEYKVDSVFAAVLNSMRGVEKHITTDRSSGYMLENLMNIVISAQSPETENRAEFCGFDFSGVDFSGINLNGKSFINCDFINAKNIVYENLLPEGHMGEIISLEASDDGKTITSIGLDDQRIVWDAFSKKMISTSECSSFDVLQWCKDKRNVFSNSVANKLDELSRNKFEGIKFQLIYQYSQLIFDVADIVCREMPSIVIAIADMELFILDDLWNIISSRIVWDEHDIRIKPEHLALADDMLFLSSANTLYQIDIFNQQNNDKKYFAAKKVFSSQYSITSLCLRNSNSIKSIIIGDVCGGIYEISITTDQEHIITFSNKSLLLVSRLIPLERDNNRFVSVTPSRNVIRMFEKREDRFERVTDICVEYNDTLKVHNLSCYNDTLILATNFGVFRTSLSQLSQTDTLYLQDDCKIISDEYIDAIIVSEDIVLLTDVQETKIYSLSKKNSITTLDSSTDSKLTLSASGRYILYSGRLPPVDKDFRKTVQLYNGESAKARLLVEDIVDRYEEYKAHTLLPSVPKFTFLDDSDEKLYFISIADDTHNYQLIVTQIDLTNENENLLYTKGGLGKIIHATLNAIKETVLFSNDMGHVFEYYYKTNIMIEFDFNNSYQRTFAYYSPDGNSALISRQSKDIISFELPSIEDVHQQKSGTISALFEEHYHYSFAEIMQFRFARLINVSGLCFNDCCFDNTLDEDVKLILRQNGAIFCSNL